MNNSTIEYIIAMKEELMLAFQSRSVFRRERTILTELSPLTWYQYPLS